MFDDVFPCTSGLVSSEELDSRALDGLKEFPPDSGLAVLEEMKSSSLENVTNKSAYMCGIMKALRQKQAAGLPTNIGVFGQKKPGPDEAKLKVFIFCCLPPLRC